MSDGPPPIAPIRPFIAAWILHRIPSQVWREAELGAVESNQVLAMQFAEARVYLQHAADWHRDRLKSAIGPSDAEIADPVADSNHPPWVSTAQAAKKLRVTRRHIVRLIDDRALRASRPPGQRAWQVDVESIEEYQMRTIA